MKETFRDRTGDELTYALNSLGVGAEMAERKRFVVQSPLAQMLVLWLQVHRTRGRRTERRPPAIDVQGSRKSYGPLAAVREATNERNIPETEQGMS